MFFSSFPPFFLLALSIFAFLSFPSMIFELIGCEKPLPFGPFSLQWLHLLVSFPKNGLRYLNKYLRRFCPLFRNAMRWAIIFVQPTIGEFFFSRLQDSFFFKVKRLATFIDSCLWGEFFWKWSPSPSNRPFPHSVGFSPVYCFAISCTKEAQEKPPGLYGMGSLI